MNSKKNILIVGGAGAVAEELVVQLPKAIIYSIDVARPKKGIPYKLHFNLNLNRHQDLKSIAKKLPDNLYVVYLASLIKNPKKSHQINKVLETNIIAVGNFLSIFKKKMKHFIYLSSVSVYGYPQYNPIDEKHPIQPSSIYGVSKASAEMLVSALSQQYSIPSTTLRVTQLFGLRSANLTLPHILIRNLAKKMPVQMTCDANEKRDYLHVHDLVCLLAEIIHNPRQGTLNVGSGEASAIFDIAKIAHEAFGVPFQGKKVESKKGPSSFSQILDINKIRKLYQFKIEYPIKKWIVKEAMKSTSSNR